MDNGLCNHSLQPYESYNTTKDHDEILQVRLNGVTTFIGIVGLTVALSVLVILLIR